MNSQMNMAICKHTFLHSTQCGLTAACATYDLGDFIIGFGYVFLTNGNQPLQEPVLTY